MKNNKKPEISNLEVAYNTLKDVEADIFNVLAENEALRKQVDELKAKYEGERPICAFDCLAVTQVQVWPFREGPSLGHIKGLAQIVLNDQMVIRGLRIMDSVNGLYVSYPSDPFYRGEEVRSVCNPITRQLREHIEAVVLEKYQQAIEA